MSPSSSRTSTTKVSEKFEYDLGVGHREGRLERGLDPAGVDGLTTRRSSTWGSGDEPLRNQTVRRRDLLNTAQRQPGHEVGAVEQVNALPGAARLIARAAAVLPQSCRGCPHPYRSPAPCRQQQRQHRPYALSHPVLLVTSRQSAARLRRPDDAECSSRGATAGKGIPRLKRDQPGPSTTRCAAQLPCLVDLSRQRKEAPLLPGRPRSRRFVTGRRSLSASANRTNSWRVMLTAAWGRSPGAQGTDPAPPGPPGTRT